ncbi:MAG TPA: response regulator transcription factor [Flavipsychrobacter sp.]
MGQLLRPITLAIADDHQMMRDGFISMLTTNYPNTFEFLFSAENGKDLINKLSTGSMSPDIILLDVSMPVMNGYIAMEIIHEKWPELKVLGMSMYDDDYVIIKMLFNGACGFITKDIALNDIYAAITTTYQKGFYFHGVSDKFYTKSKSKLKEFTPNITSQEMKFLSLCATDMQYKEMAKELCLSVRTIHSYRDSLFDKFDINNRVGLALFAITIGLKPNRDI